MTHARSPRLPAPERRELMLDAASIVFGERGYAGATTDAIAHAAGVSQAYVVRTFGSKEDLFIETATRAIERIAETFREAAHGEDADGDIQERLGRAYVELVADRGILLTFMHLLTLGHDPRIGPIARDAILVIHGLLRDEIGLSADETTAFLAQGTLINALLGLRLPDVAHTDPRVGELLVSAFGAAADEVVAMTTRQPPLPRSERGSS